MTHIAIIRHGTTAWNKTGRLQGHSDIPMDEEGIAQALKLGQQLLKEEWDLLYSSHLLRAKQTAAIIAQQLKIDTIIEDKRLGEAGGGLLEGTTEEDRVRKWGPEWNKLALGMESQEAVVSRGLSFINELLAEKTGKRILLISHGSFIRQLLGALLPEMPVVPKMNNTSITHLQFAENGWNCKLFNCIDHLK